jgi:hypothetical protein
MRARARAGRPGAQERRQIVVEHRWERLGKVRSLRERERCADEHVGHTEAAVDEILLAIEALRDGISRLEKARACLLRAFGLRLPEDRGLDERRLEFRRGKDRPFTLLAWGLVVDSVLFSLVPSVGRLTPTRASDALMGLREHHLLAPGAGAITLMRVQVG